MAGAIAGAAGWIERPAEVDRLVAALTSGESGLVVVVPEPDGVEGMGAGDVAAAALRRPEVIEHFHEGIGWASVAGRHPDHWSGEVVETVTALLGEGGEPYEGLDPDELKLIAHDEEAAVRLMREVVFRPGPRLMAIDGLGQAGLILPMAFAAPGCSWLVTADAAAGLPPFALAVRIGPVGAATAAALLRREVPGLDEGTAARLAELTGGWPLALTLARGAVLSRAVAGEPAAGAAADLVELLTRRIGPAGPGAAPARLDLADPGSRAVLIGALADHALDWLRAVDPDAAERFLELGLFGAEEAVPIGVAAMLWSSGSGMTGGEIGALIARLEGLALVERRTDDPVLVLAPAVRAYVRDRLGPDGLARARAKLIAADPAETPEGWGDLPGTVEWTLRNLPALYAAAGDTESLAGLVCDVSWLASRMHLSGVEPVIADLALAGTGEAELIARALAAASHVLELARRSGVDPLPTLAARLHAVPGKAEEAYAWLRELGGAWLECRWPPPDLPHPALRRTLHGDGEEMTDLAIAPDGTWLAASNVDERVLRWRPDGTRLDGLIGHQHAVTSVAVAPDGTWLATGSWDETVRLWRPDGTSPAELTGHLDSVRSVAIAPDGTWLAAVGQGFIRLWNADGTPRAAVSRPGRAYRQVAIAPGGGWLAAVGLDVAELWDAALTVRTDLGHDDGADAVAVAPTGEWLALLTWAGEIALVNPDGTPRALLDGVLCHGTGLAVAPDASWLAVSDLDDNVAIVGVDGHVRARLHGHGRAITAIAIAPDGSWLASAAEDHTIRVWDTDPAVTGRVVERAGQRDLYAVAVAPDGSWLATGGLGGLVVWNPDGTVRVQGPDDLTHALAIAPDGAAVLTGGTDGTVRRHEPDGTVRRSDVVTEASHVRSVAIAPDGAWTAAAHDDRVEIMAADGRVVRTLKGHGHEVDAVAVAPDSSWLAVAAGPYLRRWSPHGAALGRAVEVDDLIEALAIAPGGRSLAVATIGGDVELFDLDGTRAGRLSREGRLTGLAFSPDGSWLATTSANGSLRVWDVATRACAAAIVTDGPLRACAWFPDGSGLCAVGAAGLSGFTFHR